MAIFNMVCLLLFAVGALVRADMYLHNPRGSNNRLNENGRERRNGNRMFDSQNNNRGGYNVGNMFYYAGSKLPIQWTNQHSCGDQNSNCEIVIQYMCGSKIRDGSTTNTIPENLHQCQNFNCDNDLRFGMHENYKYYLNCKNRNRNKGLFTADQKLNGNTARFTRQNPGGTRRGYECPEERDYYPYWSPSPWKDIVIMTNNISKCEYYKKESQNTARKWACDVPKGFLECNPFRQTRTIPNTKEECERITYPLGDPDGERAVWREFPSHKMPAPDCIASPWSRDNHQGNGIGGFMNIYNWTVPNITEGSCVMRIRYNISTNDYDSWSTDSSSKVEIDKLVGLSKADAKNRGFTFNNDPVVKVFENAPKLQLRLAINTAQYGRTFQDRSHVFEIRKRPSSLATATIHNLNVRGKRGNIVQNYPAVEYDFVPNRLEIEENDYIHIQWTGSNTNPGNNAGEGRAGTDRSNFISLQPQVYAEGKPKVNTVGHFGRNYPAKLPAYAPDLYKLALIQPGAGPTLDEAGTYFNLPPAKMTNKATYFYMCTRNNNFSNRSQKGKIVVKEKKTSESKGDTKTDFDNGPSNDLINDVATVNDAANENSAENVDFSSEASRSVLSSNI